MRGTAGVYGRWTASRRVARPPPPTPRRRTRTHMPAAHCTLTPPSSSCRDPDRVVLAYTEDTEWRNRAEFIKGRDAVREVGRAGWLGGENQGAAGLRQHWQGDRPKRCPQYLMLLLHFPRSSHPSRSPPAVPTSAARSSCAASGSASRSTSYASTCGPTTAATASLCASSMSIATPRGSGSGNENWEFDQQVRAAAPGERDASCWLALFRKQWQSGCVDGV